jgi:hypothetical protein
LHCIDNREVVGLHKQKSAIILGILFLASLVSFLPLSAQATTVSIKMDSWPTAMNFSGSIGGASYGGVAGVYNFQVQGATGTFQGFCVENVTSSTSFQPYTMVPITASNQKMAVWLMDQYLHGGLNDDYLARYAVSPVDAKILAAATQTAIWEFMTETGHQWSVLAGADQGVTYTTNNIYATFAQDLVNLASTHGDFVGNYWLATNPTYQDWLIPGGTSTIPPVPIPPTVYLLGAGLLGLVGLRRKFKK